MGIAVVVMAGGRGERFWPNSREDKPKQFLALDSQETLLQKTVRRIEGLDQRVTTWVVTREDYGRLVREQLPEVPSERILLEPQGRDTAPCVALATAFVGRHDPDAVLVMLPADHLVLDEGRFRQVLRQAIRLARESKCLVTLGIRPTRPETAYGYIQLGGPVEEEAGRPAYRVESFREKPSRETAMSYLQAGGYLWNSGIFVWHISTIRTALLAHLPQLMSSMAPFEKAIGTEAEGPELRRIYPTLQRISIDYGVMERAQNALVVPADFGWDDLGTWSSLERLMEPDPKGNVVVGQVLACDTSASVLHNTATDRLLVTFGVADLVVVDTDDVVLVAHKSRVSDMKAVVGNVQAAGLEQFLRLPIRRT